MLVNVFSLSKKTKTVHTVVAITNRKIVAKRIEYAAMDRRVVDAHSLTINMNCFVLEQYAFRFRLCIQLQKTMITQRESCS